MLSNITHHLFKTWYGGLAIGALAVIYIDRHGKTPFMATDAVSKLPLIGGFIVNAPKKA